MSRATSFILNILEYLLLLTIPVLIIFASGASSFSTTWNLLWEEIFLIQSTLVIILLWFKIRRNKSERIQREQASYHSKEQFITLYERSPTPYLTVNKEGKIIQFNQATVGLLEATTDTLGQYDFFSFVHELDQGEISILIGKVQAGATVSDQEAMIRTINGRDCWVLLSTYESDMVDERLVSLVDISQQKIVDRAKSEFVALATHQLRTPISAIRWNVELLEKNLRPTKTENQNRYLIKIERNVLRMISLINDFLSVSKLETGSFATTLEPIKLKEFIDSVVDEYVENIDEKQLELKSSGVPEDFTFTSDKSLLHIIVSNLVSNAIKYSVNQGYLKITYEINSNEVVIKVVNKGIGIPEGEISQLFTKFFRASNAQAHQTEGTGLGLYIVKQSTEKLGGKIEVRSEEGGETEFVARLLF